MLSRFVVKSKCPNPDDTNDEPLTDLEVAKHFVMGLGKADEVGSGNDAGGGRRAPFLGYAD
jgi:hypothetical protein